MTIVQQYALQRWTRNLLKELVDVDSQAWICDRRFALLRSQRKSDHEDRLDDFNYDLCDEVIVIVHELRTVVSKGARLRLGAMID